MGAICSTYGEKKFRLKCWLGRDHPENLGVGGSIILKWVLRKELVCALD
jgi:hypothetical protein